MKKQENLSYPVEGTEAQVSQLRKEHFTINKDVGSIKNIANGNKLIAFQKAFQGIDDFLQNLSRVMMIPTNNSEILRNDFDQPTILKGAYDSLKSRLDSCHSIFTNADFTSKGSEELKKEYEALPTPSLLQTLPTRDQTRNQPQNQEGIYFPHDFHGKYFIFYKRLSLEPTLSNVQELQFYVQYFDNFFSDDRISILKKDFPKLGVEDLKHHISEISKLVTQFLKYYELKSLLTGFLILFYKVISQNFFSLFLLKVMKNMSGVTADEFDQMNEESQ